MIYGEQSPVSPLKKDNNDKKPNAEASGYFRMHIPRTPPRHPSRNTTRRVSWPQGRRSNARSGRSCRIKRRKCGSGKETFLHLKNRLWWCCCFGFWGYFVVWGFLLVVLFFQGKGWQRFLPWKFKDLSIFGWFGAMNTIHLFTHGCFKFCSLGHLMNQIWLFQFYPPASLRHHQISRFQKTPKRIRGPLLGG